MTESPTATELVGQPLTSSSQSGGGAQPKSRQIGRIAANPVNEIRCERLMFRASVERHRSACVAVLIPGHKYQICTNARRSEDISILSRPRLRCNQLQ